MRNNTQSSLLIISYLKIFMKFVKRENIYFDKAEIFLSEIVEGGGKDIMTKRSRHITNCYLRVTGEQ